MKRTLMLLMATALLVFSLASCGCSAQQAGTMPENGGQNNSAVTGGNNESAGGQTNPGNGTAQAPNDPMHDSSGNVIDETIDGVTGAVEDAGNALTGNGTNDTTGGVTYEEMLRNGRVHDRDGDLTDGENASVNKHR